MRHALRAILNTAGCSLAAGALGACGPAWGESKEPASDAAQEEAAFGDSAEWLFATSALSGDRKAVCQHVRQVVLGEAGCKGASCQYASRLARDWLAVCRDLSPTAATKIETLQQELQTRSEQPPSPCAAQLQLMLREGCRQDADCTNQAQEWVTRCGSAEATPLVIVMLEQTLEQTMAQPRRVRLDPRSCEQLAGELRKGSGCVQRFQCEDQLPKLELYQARCRGPKAAPLAPVDAAAVVSILLGAAQSPEPIAVAATPSKLPAETVPLRLQSGAGLVLQVCEERVVDLAGYLAARKQCQNGQVTMAHLFAGAKETRTLRVGVLPHPDDVSFFRRFPSLRVDGELSAREPAALLEFASGLDEAVRRGARPGGLDAGLAMLVQTLGAHWHWVRSSPAFSKALQERDDALVPLFVELAKVKDKTPTLKTRARDLIPFVRRGIALPLADVDRSGTVVLGAATLVSSLKLDSVLPRATAAYRNGLERLRRLIRDVRIQRSHLELMLSQAKQQASSCGAAENRVGSSQRDLLACVCRVSNCSEQRVTALIDSLDQAQLQAEQGFVQARLGVTGLASEEDLATDSLLSDAGCREPWW